MKKIFLNLLATLLLTAATHQATAQGTIFTYQGRLDASGTPANGTYAMQFDLYATPTNGAPLGSLNITNLGVTNGLFSVPLDFGAAFDGSPRWLEITVQASGGQPTILAPRQQITAAPYAITAASAQSVLGPISASNLTGQIPLSQLPNAVVTNGASGINFSGTFSGDGSQITNVSASTLNTFGLLTWPAYFVLNSTFPVGATPRSVVALDVNNDGKLDLVTANSGTNTLSVLTNGGNGVFALQSTLTVGSGPYSVTAADINNDGKLDLICANFNDNTLTVLTNNGNGQFIALTPPLHVGQGPTSVCAEDVNADGRMDLICANANDDTLTVLTNDGHSGFMTSSLPIQVDGIPFAVVGADFNGDGKMDLACANVGDGSITILTNNGSGQFALKATIQVGSTSYSLVPADVNGDGRIDLVAANFGDNSLSIVTNGSNGTFGVSATNHIGAGPQMVTAADLNGDGKIDLISADYADGSIYILTNSGSGVFVASDIVTIAGQPLAVVAGDFNSDGKPDIAAVTAPNQVAILLNTPTVTGSFNGNGSALTALNASSLATGTVPDSRLSSHVALLNNSPTFTSPASFTKGLSVGTNGTQISSLRFGVLTLYSPFTNGTPPSLEKVTNTFDTPFATVPHLVFSTQNTSGEDKPFTISVTIDFITTTNVVLNVVRTDIVGSWNNIALNYIAWEP